MVVEAFYSSSACLTAFRRLCRKYTYIFLLSTLAIIIKGHDTLIQETRGVCASKSHCCIHLCGSVSIVKSKMFGTNQSLCPLTSQFMTVNPLVAPFSRRLRFHFTVFIPFSKVQCEKFHDRGVRTSFIRSTSLNYDGLGTQTWMPCSQPSVLVCWGHQIRSVCSGVSGNRWATSN